MDFLPYGKQFIDEDDIKAVEEVLRSNWLTTGPKVKEFEEKLAEKVGAKYVVAVNSGTAALHAAYYAAGLGEGDEFITSPITFAATANAGLYLKSRPVFVDIESETGNIDVNKIEDAITSKTKVISPVDFSGQPADLTRIMQVARDNNLVTIEDAAHALGAIYQGKPVGSIADMTIFSFHPVKHITTGEGGAIATDNEEYYKKLLAFRSHGITKNPDELMEYHGPWYHEMQTLGYNYRISDISCALGLSQLSKLDNFLARRAWISRQYNAKLESLREHLVLPSVKDQRVSAWHLFVIQVKGGTEERRRLFEYLHSRNIGVQVHYLPVYLHPYYQSLGYSKGLCPEAEDFYSKVISLPIFPEMKEEDIDKVCRTLYEYFGVIYNDR
ncbi:MAG: UDP-4-amino-4,6-dideoxy-N-acetyl-beta-L-altrosamine transaminase [Desulfitobacterium hafniense]|nr:UDP-4-amino-4,6-dideoxy-N-acetyl-beta-L-altrosamine transaminase [Desulfitobacterium hafniense]